MKPFKSLVSLDYLQSVNPGLEARTVFKTSELTKGLYLEENQIYTARVVGVSIKERFLKRIDFILIVTDGKHSIAEALSHDAATHHIATLDEAPRDNNIKHQVFILRADGVLYQKGSGSLAPSEGDIEKIVQSSWLQDI